MSENRMNGSRATGDWMIEAEGVSVSYGRARVLDGVDVRIPRGGVTSVIGPNGAGKSTLLTAVARLQPMDAGTVCVGGLDVARADSTDLAKTLAILRQENHVTLRLTVRQLVLFGRYPHTKGRPGVEDRRLAAEAMDAVGLTELAERNLDELSGGQRQRAYIAMVLAQDAECVLLDEPLNNLDLKHSAEMMRLVRRLADEHGKTMVLVVHDINFASAHSDALLAMKGGRVAAHGSPEEIMRTDVLREIFDAEIPVQEIGGKRMGLYY